MSKLIEGLVLFCCVVSISSTVRQGVLPPITQANPDQWVARRALKWLGPSISVG